ncbi:MAG: formate--tetrahydrofolate ligase [Bradymonadales bacterium]|jgi:formate--tetrahydrofolate ligase
MNRDAEIAQNIVAKNIEEIAESIDISPDELICYGKEKAKIRITPGDAKAKLVLITAMTPTPYGEGKTTCSVGLNDAFAIIGKRSIVALREPSMGPVFGMKGGATGGGHAQLIPMQDINLHFTGDLHAITAANNLIAALIDNHIQQGNALRIEPRRILWKRCIDTNDRSLRNIVIGLGGKPNGVPRETGFDISVASEIMAILCLAESLADLKERIASIVVAYNVDNEWVSVRDLGVQGAVAAVLKDAFYPNLVQSLEHNPAIIHGGPFANIAHGCSSVVATKLALSKAEIVITEAGFGADLGAEKFIDIKARMLGRMPDAVVLVVTLRAIMYHAELKDRGDESIISGFENVKRHLRNIRDEWGLPVVVGINVFETDARESIELVKELCKREGVACELSDSWARGGLGSVDLAKAVLRSFNDAKNPRFTYELQSSMSDKIFAVCQKIYGAKSVSYAPKALNELKRLENSEYRNLPVCMAKTQYSFSDNAKLTGAPKDFDIQITELRLRAGAGFVVAIAGNMMTMPGLPKVPAANAMDIDENGVISGLF